MAFKLQAQAPSARSAKAHHYAWRWAGGSHGPPPRNAQLLLRFSEAVVRVPGSVPLHLAPPLGPRRTLGLAPLVARLAVGKAFGKPSPLAALHGLSPHVVETQLARQARGRGRGGIGGIHGTAEVLGAALVLELRVATKVLVDLGGRQLLQRPEVAVRCVLGHRGPVDLMLTAKAGRVARRATRVDEGVGVHRAVPLQGLELRHRVVIVAAR
eukprot:scaffold87284_cov67-Phaeocystis_antarctica.AAC.5